MSSITPILQHHSGGSLVLRNQRKPRGRCREEGARRTRRPPAANSVKRGTQNSETVSRARRGSTTGIRGKPVSPARLRSRSPGLSHPWGENAGGFVAARQAGRARRTGGSRFWSLSPNNSVAAAPVAFTLRREPGSPGGGPAQGTGAGAACARSHAGCSGVRGPGCPRGVWAQSPLDAKGQLCSRLQQQRPKEAKGPEPTAEGLWGRTGRRSGLPLAPARREDASTARPSLLPSSLSCRNVCLF